MIGLTVKVEREVWRKLRDLAEEEKMAGGRASVSRVVARIVQEAVTRRK